MRCASYENIIQLNKNKTDTTHGDDGWKFVSVINSISDRISFKVYTGTIEKNTKG